MWSWQSSSWRAALTCLPWWGRCSLGWDSGSAEWRLRLARTRSGWYFCWRVVLLCCISKIPRFCAPLLQARSSRSRTHGGLSTQNPWATWSWLLGRCRGCREIRFLGRWSWIRNFSLSLCPPFPPAIRRIRCPKLLNENACLWIGWSWPSEPLHRTRCKAASWGWPSWPATANTRWLSGWSGQSSAVLFCSSRSSRFPNLARAYSDALVDEGVEVNVEVVENGSLFVGVSQVEPDQRVPVFEPELKH